MEEHGTPLPEHVLDSIRRFPVPVVAALNGDALGGGAELAVACDMRVAATHARIGFVQGRLAITTGWGGGIDLAAIVGPSRALALLCRSDLLTSAEAGRITSCPRTTTLPETVSSWLVRGSKLRRPPGMIATPPTLASVSSTIDLVTTAVCPGPGTPCDQDPGSLQRFPRTGDSAEVPVGCPRAGTVVVVGPGDGAWPSPRPRYQMPPAIPPAPTAPPRTRKPRRLRPPTSGAPPGARH